MTDIKLESGECLSDSLSLGYEDLELVEGSDCLLQDIRNKLLTDFGSLYYDPAYGSGVLRYIQASRDDLTLQEIKQEIKIALKRDDRIVSNSIKVSFTDTQSELIINIEFISSDNEKLNTEIIL